ncbi:MAG: DUF5996 family protein [Acidobacteriota bacterium]
MSSAGMLARTSEPWPPLPLENWKDTRDTLHMWTQIAGKLRLELTPLVNHYWNSTLYVNSRGLTTSAIPYRTELFNLQFDFIDHKLVVRTSAGATKTVGLYPRTVADFYREFMSTLGSLGIDAKIHTMPVEVPDPIAFDKDTTHKSYDREYVERFWRVLISCADVMEEFRARFIGKCSPVHFFWGSFDLAVTRFSGRRAPERPGADAVTREAYSHECISAGFWTGSGEVTEPAFYSYAAPAPEGYDRAEVHPGRAFYSPQLGEYLLMYDDVRNTGAPRDALLDFMQSAYEAGANLAHWDREALERRESDGR